MQPSHPLLPPSLLPSIFPRISVFPNEQALSNIHLGNIYQKHGKHVKWTQGVKPWRWNITLVEAKFMEDGEMTRVQI